MYDIKHNIKTIAIARLYEEETTQIISEKVK